MSCIRFLLVFLCVVHLLGLRRGGGRWWWQPISFPYTSVSLFSHGVFRCCPLRSFPCALVPQGLPPWGVVVQGISGRFTLFARYPLGHFLIVTLSHPLPLFFLGGERKNILLTLLLCTAVTLTIDLIYEFPVTVGRKFTCVLDGFSDLNYVGLGG